MKMTEIRERAKAENVKATGTKANVIRRIQQAEGNEQCFSAREECDQSCCCWRGDCLPSVQCD